MRRRLPRRFVIPAQFLTTYVVHAVTIGRTVVGDGAGPPGAADGAMNVLEDAVLEHVLVLVRVTGHDVRLVRREQPVERNPVRHHVRRPGRAFFTTTVLRAQ